MASQTLHPLAVFLAAPATTGVEPEEESPYDPIAQLQVQWKDIPDHREILCSGKSTGDPETKSQTTGNYHPKVPNYNPDYDTDDSGT